VEIAAHGGHWTDALLPTLTNQPAKSGTPIPKIFAET
jgi:hypothetical protein